MIRIFITLATIGIVVIISACTSSPATQKNEQMKQSETRAALIRQLPADADITRMGEQLPLIEKGFYITRGGSYSPLAVDHPARTIVMQGRPAVSNVTIQHFFGYF